MRSARRWISNLLILAGILSLVYTPVTWLYTRYQQRSLEDRFDALMALPPPVDKPVAAGQSSPSQEKPDFSGAAASFAGSLSPGALVAKLTLPSAGVEAVIVEGSDDAALRLGPGHVSQTPLPGMGGNFTVAGDRVLYSAPFLRLDRVQVDDRAEVTTPYGRFSYRVTEKFMVTPDQVEVLENRDRETLTLITCDPIWDITRRLIVVADLEASSLMRP